MNKILFRLIIFTLFLTSVLGCKKTEDNNIVAQQLTPFVPKPTDLIGTKWSVTKIEGTAIISSKCNSTWDATKKAEDWTQGANDVPKLIFISDTKVVEDDALKYLYKYTINGKIITLESQFDIGHRILFRIEMVGNNLFLYNDDDFFKEVYAGSNTSYKLCVKQADIKYTYQKN